MLRVVVPTVYCRDPLDEMFGSSCGYFYPPRVLPCRQMNSLMGLSSLAAFVEAMEGVETSTEDGEDNTCGCSCQQKKNKPSEGSANKEQCCEANSEESGKPSSNEQTQNSTSSPSTHEQPPNSSCQSSEGEKTSEAVSVPLQRLGDLNSNRFQVSLNLSSFEPDDIEVNRVDNELKVHAKEKVERYGMIFHREIRRSYQLPDDVDAESLKSTLSTAGVLTIEAQRRPRDSDDNSQQSGEQGHADVKGSLSEEALEEPTERPEDGDVADDQEVSPDGDTQMETTEEPVEEEQMDKKSE